MASFVYAHELVLRERAKRHFDEAAIEFGQAARNDKDYRLSKRKALAKGGCNQMAEAFQALSELKALNGAEEV